MGTKGLLQLVPSPTPRWPDLLVAYMPSERLLFTSKLFSAHVRCGLRTCLACTTHLSSLLLNGEQTESAMSSESLMSTRIYMGSTDSWLNVNMCRQQCMAQKIYLRCTAVLQRLASQKGRPRIRAAGSATAQTGATSSSACWHQSRGRPQVGCRASPHIAHNWNASHSCVAQESQSPSHFK